MGANAQTTVPTFVDGQVLTAAQQNQSARTGVPVFADTTDRDAAFGGTGEKTLAEGQLCYVENLTGDAQIQYYDGATWNSLGATGLTLVSATTIGNAVSSVTVSNAFSSTYDNYLVSVSGGASSTATKLILTLGATTTGYYFGGIGTSFAGTNTFASGANVANIDFIGYANTDGIMARFDVLAPNLAKNTVVSTVYAQNVTTGTLFSISGYVANTTAYTAFTLATGTGTLTGGTIRVYGYRN